MLNGSTLDKLSALRLHEIATAWHEQQRIADHAALTFDCHRSCNTPQLWSLKTPHPL